MTPDYVYFPNLLILLILGGLMPGSVDLEGRGKL